MSWVIAAVAAAAAVLAVTLLVLLKKNLRAARRTLAEVNREGGNRRLRLASPDREAEALFAQINELLESMARSDVAHERREKELRQEIANISHDLRTPLTSILGYLQLLRAGACTPEEREEYLAVIEGRARALQLLVTGFYDLSRLEAGGYTFECRDVRLDQVLEEQVAAFYYDLTEKKMVPELDVEKSLPPIYADPYAVGRIYTNLMQNALKHGEGVLRITARREGGEVVTRLSNRAPGLLPQDVGHLFDRFFTADRMRTGHDTGLGLAIVRKLAGQMGAKTEAALTGADLTITVRWPVRTGSERRDRRGSQNGESL